jgi:hypothetical protein
VLPTPSDIFVVVGGGFTAALRVHRIASHRMARRHGNARADAHSEKRQRNIQPTRARGRCPPCVSRREEEQKSLLRFFQNKQKERKNATSPIALSLALREKKEEEYWHTTAVVLVVQKIFFLK